MVQVKYDPLKGQARVWDVQNQRYVWRSTVDCREGMYYGAYTPYAPDDDPETFMDNRFCVELRPATHLPPVNMVKKVTVKVDDEDDED